MLTMLGTCSTPMSSFWRFLTSQLWSPCILVSLGLLSRTHLPSPTPTIDRSLPFSLALSWQVVLDHEHEGLSCDQFLDYVRQWVVATAMDRERCYLKTLILQNRCPLRERPQVLHRANEVFGVGWLSPGVGPSWSYHTNMKIGRASC